jgi:hypothetical protein
MTAPIDFANAAADNLEQLATFRSYEWPSDVYDIAGGLYRSVVALEEILSHARAWLAAEHEAARLGHDETTDAATVNAAFLAAWMAFDRAEDQSNELAHALDDARQIVSHLTGI